MTLEERAIDSLLQFPQNSPVPHAFHNAFHTTLALHLLMPRTSILARILLMACTVAAFAGCSDKEAEYRAIMCKRARVPKELIERCKATTEDYDRIMETEQRARREEEEIAIFHETLATLPPRRTPDHQYEAISLKDLSIKIDKLGELEESQWTTHPLFRKRFSVRAWVNFYPTDVQNRRSEYTTLAVDHSGTTWIVEADTEPLSREERLFIKNHCLSLLESCYGEFYGTVGVIDRDELLLPGFQIEYIDIGYRKKSKETS